MDSDLLHMLDGFSGLAALVNGALLWPIVRSLKRVTHDHGTRLLRLEERRARRTKAARKKARRAP